MCLPDRSEQQTSRAESPDMLQGYAELHRLVREFGDAGDVVRRVEAGRAIGCMQLCPGQSKLNASTVHTPRDTSTVTLVQLLIPTYHYLQRSYSDTAHAKAYREVRNIGQPQ